MDSTPYVVGKVELRCLPDTICDFIIGNVSVVRRTVDSDLRWQEACAVTTRSQRKKEGQHTLLQVASTSERAILDKAELIQM